jgi:predicted GNAT superfamily acetyltransferase
VAGSQAVVEIRQLFHLADFEEVLRLQQAIWGFPDIELLPLRFLVVVNSVGGHVFGAYDGDMMVGFCFAIPGVKSGGQPYLHSHMLGVLPAYRDAHVGRNLKLKQREEALARGIQLIEWTFDPLELKNAFFNIERLGAIVRRYHENQYGITFSPLHGGLPTDRCYAEWWIASPRVEAVVGGTATSPPDPLGRTSEAITHPSDIGRTPSGCPPGPPDPVVRPSQAITYPADIARIRTEDPRRARLIQKENGEKFRQAFEQGLAVTRFQRGERQSSYLLEPWK